MQRASDSVPSGDDRLLRVLLPVSVFVSGAVVMVIEVLCTRLIAPVYGTSLHVWSATIAVTLLALSVGYWLGGRVADRHPYASGFFLVFEIAALLIVLLPLAREPVLSLTQPLGLRGGALGAAILFLAAPLTLLGMISPYAVRLAAHLLTDLGRTAGRLYALSTAGSLLGTLLAGFYLIPSFRLRSVFLGSALLLVVPAVVYQALAARRQLAAVALLLVAAGLVAAKPRATADGIRHVSESHFGQLKVLDYGGARTMLVNGTIQTQTIAGTNVALTAYAPLLTELAWRAHPKGRRALIVGLGGGVLAPLLGALGVKSQVVEIDPEIVAVAREYFAFDPRRTPVAIADGRQFLASTDDHYDYIVLDAFAGEVLPVHLLTREMVELLDERLAEGGVVVLNYLGYRAGERARPLRSVVRTIETRFPHVVVYPSYPAGDYGNNIVLAAREPIRLRGGPRPFPVPPWLEEQVRVQPPLDVSGPAIVLSDDYNPLDLWSVDASEAWRRAALTTFAPEVLYAE
ncbi:MAG: fused MFS/spermidine synthase [Thermodesulfobacteriota bacterium]